jgi:hypothetical protein
MMTMKKSLVGLVAALVLLSASAAFAQPGEGSFGIQASLQDNHTEIGLPIWGSSFVVEPFLSFASVSDAGKDLGVGALFRFNLKQGDAVPYFGVRVAMLYFSPEEGDSVTDFVAGPALGGEYFLSPHFSLGVEAQVNIAISDEASSRFGNPDGTNINTASMATATFYF